MDKATHTTGDVLRQAGLLLRVLRLKAGVGQSDMAAHLSVSQPTISRFEKGISRMTPVQLERWVGLCRGKLEAAQQPLAQEAGLALARLLAAGDSPAQEEAGAAERALVLELAPAQAAIPYYADVAAGVGESQEPRTKPRARLEVPSHLLQRDPGCYALRVSGASMEPLLYDGDIVVISPAAQLTDGCIAAAWVEPDGDVVKLYHPLPGGGAVLQPANPAFPVLLLGLEHGRSGRIWGRVVFQQREL